MLAIGGVSVGGGVTLTIEPGVEVRFISGSLTVSGELIAIGTPEQPIVFTSDAATPGASAWGGINFVGGGTVIDANLDYVSGTILQHCEVRFSSGIALRSPTYIANCGIYDVAGVSGASGTSVAIYSDGVIVRDSLIIGGSTAKHNKGIWTESRRVHLVGNTVSNHYWGLYADFAMTGTVRGNTITGHPGGDIIVNGGLGDLLIEGNTIGSMELEANESENVTIRDNEIGSAYIAPSNGPFLFVENIVGDRSIGYGSERLDISRNYWGTADIYEILGLVSGIGAVVFDSIATDETRTEFIELSLPLPVAHGYGVTTDEDTPISIELFGSDAGGDPLTYRIVSPPANGSVSGVGPNITYTPNANFVGSDSFTFVVNDGAAESLPGTMTVTVVGVNEAPTALDQTLLASEDTPMDITLQGHDVDGDALTFTVTTQPGNGTLSGEAPELTYAPGPDFFGSDSFTFTVDDLRGGIAEGVIDITVAPVNDDPSFTPPAAQTVLTNAGVVEIAIQNVSAGSERETDQTVTITATSSNPSVVPHPEVAGVGATHILTYRPSADSSGFALITLAADDGEGGSFVRSFGITVVDPNAPPPGTVTVAPPQHAFAGQDAVFEADITASVDFGPDAVLYHREGGTDAPYLMTQFAPGAGATWSATVPGGAGSAVTARGLLWYTRVVDVDGKAFETHSAAAPGYLAVQGAVEIPLYPTNGAQSVWNAIVPPVATGGARAGWVFDGVGGFLSSWMAWRWSAAGQQWEVAQSMDGSTPVATDPFDSGTGWVLAVTGSSAPLFVTGASVDPRLPFRVWLHPGWNLVGNPFAFPIEWGDSGVLVAADGAELLLSAAVANGLVVGRVYTLDGAAQTYREHSVYDPLVDGLPPGQAWWVLANAPVELLIFGMEAGSGGPPPLPSTP